MGAGRLRAGSRSRDRRLLSADRAARVARRKNSRAQHHRERLRQTKEPFSFKTLGLLAAIGRRTGVARILGVNFSGFLAWFLWRGIYWSKLPRIEKKIRVAIDWALDVFFSKDFVQYLDQRALVISADRDPHGAVEPRAALSSGQAD